MPEPEVPISGLVTYWNRSCQLGAMVVSGVEGLSLIDLNAEFVKLRWIAQCANLEFGSHCLSGRNAHRPDCEQGIEPERHILVLLLIA